MVLSDVTLQTQGPRCAEGRASEKEGSRCSQVSLFALSSFLSLASVDSGILLCVVSSFKSLKETRTSSRSILCKLILTFSALQSFNTVHLSPNKDAELIYVKDDITDCYHNMLLSKLQTDTMSVVPVYKSRFR